MANLNTPYGVLSFANLFTPRPRAEGKEPDFNCSIIFDPQQQKSSAYKALKAAHTIDATPERSARMSQGDARLFGSALRLRGGRSSQRTA